MVLVATAAAAWAAPRPDGLPPSRLDVLDPSGTWSTVWRSDAAPDRWSGPHPAMEKALTWRGGAHGVEWAELSLRGSGPGLRFGVVVARVDPRRVRFEVARGRGGSGGWTLDRAPTGAVLAVNAGQFTEAGPWGWLVVAGRELQAPAPGPLSQAVTVGRDGAVRLVPARELDALRDPALRPVLAFQSYPALLDDGAVPSALRGSGRGVDVAHRDLRLAVGELPDGRLLVVLTRFGDPSGALGRLPVGPTVPELAGLMGALGSVRAVALDGGLSAQLLVGDAAGVPHRWPGLRGVPLALVARPRPDPEPGSEAQPPGASGAPTR